MPPSRANDACSGTGGMTGAAGLGATKTGVVPAQAGGVAGCLGGAAAVRLADVRQVSGFDAGLVHGLVPQGGVAVRQRPLGRAGAGRGAMGPVSAMRWVPVIRGPKGARGDASWQAKCGVGTGPGARPLRRDVCPGVDADGAAHRKRQVAALTRSPLPLAGSSGLYPAA